MPQISKAFLGGTELKKGYLGSTLLFDNTATGPSAPTFDARTSYRNDTSIDPHTFSHTVGTGSNRRLVVFVCNDDGRTVTAVRWGGSGGTLLTKLGGGQHGSGSTLLEVWELLNPSSGTQNVWIDFSSICRAGAFAISYSDSDQVASAVGALAQATSTNTISPNVTPSVANAAIVSAMAEGNGSSQGNTGNSPTSGQTETVADLQIGTSGSSTATMSGGESAGPDPAAQVTHGWQTAVSVSRIMGIAVAVPGL